jgi:serine/threonine-protein kinase
VETLRQVAGQEPVPLRQFNSSIDRDLETICLKCLAKEPAGRYESAQALADDVEHYLAGRPIKARPLSTVARSIRWCRRRPIHAVALLLLIVTCGVSIAAWVATDAARRQSEQSHRQTREVVNSFLTRIGEDELLNQPGMQLLRRDLLEQARDHYQRFVRERGSDPALRAELAEAHFRLGQVEALLGEHKQAQSQYEAARIIQADLADRHNDDQQRMALSKTLTALGEVHMRHDNVEQAWASFVEAERLRRALCERHPANREFSRLLANATMHLGLIAKSRGDFSAARDNLQRAEQRRRELLKQGDNADVRRDLGRGLYNLGGLEIETASAARANNDPAAAEEHFQAAEKALREAIDIFKRLAADHPRDLGHHFRLAECWRLLADVQARNLEGEAGKHYAEALPELEQLAYENPFVVEYHAALAAMQMNLGRWEFDSGRPSDAVARFREAEKCLDLLTRLRSQEPRHLENLGASLRAIGEIEALQGNPESARACLARAKQAFSRLAADFPKRQDYQAQRDACGQALEQLEASIQAKDGK